MTLSPMKLELLKAAEQLVRRRGYSAFSYADLSQAVGIRKASIHHHFPSKTDLGVALVDAYVERFRDTLQIIDGQEPTAYGRLSRYGDIYVQSVHDGMICLCGMLASEINVLPDDVRRGVRAYFSEQLRWLMKVMSQGVTNGEVTFPTTVENSAEHFLSTLQGSSLVAWGMNDPVIVQRAKEALLTSLYATGAPPVSLASL